MADNDFLLDLEASNALNFDDFMTRKAPSLEVESTVSWELADRVEKIMKPLRQEFNVNFFSYCRHYPDGSWTFLFNEGYSINAVTQHEDYPGEAGSLPPGLYIWANHVTENLLNMLQEEYNQYNGMTFVSRHNGVEERFGFTFAGHSAENQTGIMALDASYLSVLQRFIMYFKNEGKQIIKIADKNRINLPTTWAPIIEPPKEELFKVKRYYLIGNNGETHLSNREMEILDAILRFKSIKEIAFDLKISVRTVEFHVTNINKKLGCYRRSDLFTIAKNNSIIL